MAIGQKELSVAEEGYYNGPGSAEFQNEHAARLDLNAQEPPDLPSVKFAESGPPFSFESNKGLVEVWSRKSGIPNVFFFEDLPSLFIRKLDFEAFEFSGGFFEWIFTGDRGGATVSVSENAIVVYQRFYDSFGFNQLEGNAVYAKNYAETRWISHTVPYTGKIRDIAVSVDHRLFLTLYVNGHKASEQTCLFDLTKHQLRFSGEKVFIKGRLFTPETGRAELRADWDTARQEILGWGGITSPVAYRMFSEKGRELWWKYIREYNLLLHREYPNGQRLKRDFGNFDTPSDATPHYYGDNFPNGEISDFRYIDRLQKEGGETFFEFWKLPPWVQTDSEFDLASYCEAMVAYCKKAKEATGRPPAVVGIQNEVHQPAERWKAMILALRKALDDNGFENVKIHQQDMAAVIESHGLTIPVRKDQKVWDTLDYAASHMYDYQTVLHDPDAFDDRMRNYRREIGEKPFLATEIAFHNPQWQFAGYRIAFSMAMLFHKNLAILDASCLMYCWTLLNTVQPSYTASRSLFAVDEMNGFIPRPSGFVLRALGAFSRRVKKGMKRVEIASRDADILATAFKGEQGRTLIMINRSQAEKECRIALDEPFLYMEKVSQYFANEICPAPEGKDGKLTVKILPGEIITLSSVPLG